LMVKHKLPWYNLESGKTVRVAELRRINVDKPKKASENGNGEA